MIGLFVWMTPLATAVEVLVSYIYMVEHPGKIALVNTLGTLGYISIIFQWLWSVVVLANPLLSGDLRFLMPEHTSTAPPAPSAPPSPLIIGFVVALTIVIFVMTIYVLWKLPKTVGRRAGDTTKRAADIIAPLVLHHVVTSKKERRKISHGLVLIIKWGLVILPLISLVFASPIGQLTRDITLIVGLFCAVCSSLYFGLQLLLARLWAIPYERVW